MTITIDDHIVFEQRDNGERVVHRCATRRVAQILAAELELHDATWVISGLRSSDAPRRPLMLPGEKMCRPLDGARSDERAQGFRATRGADLLHVDASAGLHPTILAESGDTTEARRIVEWHLGPLS